MISATTGEVKACEELPLHLPRPICIVGAVAKKTSVANAFHAGVTQLTTNAEVSANLFIYRRSLLSFLATLSSSSRSC